MSLRLSLLCPLALAAGALGCAQAQLRRQVFQYSNMIVIRAEPWEVDQACARLETRNDDRDRITRHIRCCWDGARKQMWVSWDDVDCIPHELCHADGQAKETCRDLHWK